MNSRKNQAYTRDDQRRWMADQTLRQPGPLPDFRLISGVDVVALRTGASANGAYVRIVNSHGEIQTLLLNPIVAAALRDGLIEAGRDGGWFDADGAVVPGR